MDDLVIAALKKWPNVPACYGWLGLDARGQWWMRDDRSQRSGAFSSGAPGSKGSHLRHDKLIEFIGRNYERESAGPMAGAWFFQNGPQKVYVELESTPLIMRVFAHSDGIDVSDHRGKPAKIQRCLLDESGRLYLHTDLGLGLVHTQDMNEAAQAIEMGMWEPEMVSGDQLPILFGFMQSPALSQSLCPP